MSDHINALALDATCKINDLFVQSHASVAQRTARVQIAVREAIQRALAAAEYDRKR